MFLIRQTTSAQNSNEMGDRERVRNEQGEEKINRRVVIWRKIAMPSMPGYIRGVLGREHVKTLTMSFCNVAYFQVIWYKYEINVGYPSVPSGRYTEELNQIVEGDNFK